MQTMSSQVASRPHSSQLQDESVKASSDMSKRGDGDLTPLPLDFPPQTTDPSSSVTPLRDDQSSHASVAKACLQLCQYAGHGSGSVSQDTSTVASSAIFHDPSYVKSVSTCIAALQECMQHHKDRRCRILACQTLGIVARSAYARIRHSPLLFAMRDPAVNRLEDEISTDVPVALATVLLNDEDDGVSAHAMQAIGTIILSSSCIPGTVVEDELLLQIQSIALGRASPYAPTLRAVVDEDPAIPLAELQIRVQENVLSPRMLQILDRIVLYPDTSFVATALPCLTACLIHLVRTTPALLSVMDRTTFSKRWSEADARSLVDTAVNALVMPLLQTSIDGAAVKAAALSAMRLAHVCPHAPWATNVVRWAAVVLDEDMMDTEMPLEHKLTGLAASVIACRALPLRERTPRFIRLAQQLVKLPPSISIASTVSSAGMLVSWQGWKGYRRPSRIGIWTEIALSYFVDNDESPGASDHLKTFLSALLADIPKDDEGISAVNDEVLLVFTTVALDVGRCFRLTPDESVATMDWHSPAVNKWLQLCWVILHAFLACVLSGPKLAYLDEDISLITAGLTAYVQLLQEYLHGVGLLQPFSSVSLKLVTNACPPHVLWDRLMESAALLSKFEAIDKGVLDPTTQLMDEVVARELRHGIPSHHMRLFLLSLAADHWVQGRTTSIQSNFETPTGSSSSISLNANSGKDIITALSPKRILHKIYAAHAPVVSTDGRSKRDSVKKLLGETVKVCVACIENVALACVAWKRRFGGSDAKQVISAAVASLQTKADDMLSDEIVTSIIQPICEAAINRIHSNYENGSNGSVEFPMSDLVTQPVKTKIKPLISSTKPSPVPKKNFQRGFWMQLCRQIIIARARQAQYSTITVDSNVLARARSPLRLTIPPVPESRDGRILGSFGNPLEASDVWVKSCSAASDATQIVMAVTPQRHLRYDGDDEFRIGILFRIFNMTAVDLEEGIRLEVGATLRQPQPDEDTAAKYFADSLNSTVRELVNETPLLFSASTFYRQEVKSGDSLTWEVSLTHEFSSSSCPLDIHPSVVYQNLVVEPEDSGTLWAGVEAKADASVAGGSTVGGGSKSGEDDFYIADESGGKASSKDSLETESVRVAGDVFPLPPMVRLQPCPLVFFCDRWGDYETFRFLWFRMPHQLPPMKLETKIQLEGFAQERSDPISKKIASMSRLNWSGEAIPGGFAAKAWAFSTLSGDRVLCIFAVSDNQGNNPGKQALYFRGDNRSVLFALVSSPSSRKAVVNAMVPDLAPSA